MRNTVTAYGAGPRSIPVEPDGPSAALLGDRPMLRELAGYDRGRRYAWGP